MQCCSLGCESNNWAAAIKAAARGGRPEGSLLSTVVVVDDILSWPSPRVGAAMSRAEETFAQLGVSWTMSQAERGGEYSDDSNFIYGACLFTVAPQ